MDLTFLLKGIVIGFSIAAPVGPIGILCIQRTLHFGRASGFLTGLGAATADGFYGAVAAFGLTAVTSFFAGGESWFRLIGGTFLLWLGIATLLRRPASESPGVRRRGLLSDYLSTVFLTLANPATILSFIAVFAGLGLAGTGGDRLAAAGMVAGVFLGSAGWWLLLSNGVGLLRTHLDARALRLVNIVSGVILLGFAGFAFAALI